MVKGVHLPRTNEREAVVIADLRTVGTHRSV
jgi:hypothetical protein